MMKISMVAALAAGLLTASVPAVADGDLPSAWPRPGARLLVENDRGAAYNVIYPKGVPAPMHRHRYPFAGLDLDTATIRLTELSGKQILIPALKDRMWYLPAGLAHSEMSTTNPGRHTVVIDIKEKTRPETPNDSGFPTNKYGSYQNRIVDNDRVAIWDVAWASRGEATPAFHSRDMFLAFAAGGTLKIASDGGKPVVTTYKTGEAIFLPAGQVRTISSVAGTVRAMLVELK